jgi:hypothetical protein
MSVSFDAFLNGWLKTLTDDQRVKVLGAMSSEDREKALKALGVFEQPDPVMDAARKAAGLPEKKGE